jgi:hypothetical protein
MSDLWKCGYCTGSSCLVQDTFWRPVLPTLLVPQSVLPPGGVAATVARCRHPSRENNGHPGNAYRGEERPGNIAVGIPSLLTEGPGGFEADKVWTNSAVLIFCANAPIAEATRAEAIQVKSWLS